MSLFSFQVQELFRSFDKAELCARLENRYANLLIHQTSSVTYGDNSGITSQQRTAANCIVIQQALLHRTERLLASSGAMLLDANVYGLALLVRGQCETSAALGYFCDRLESLILGNIKFEDFEWNLADVLLGARHPLFDKARPPPNILTCIEKTDRYLDKHVFASKKAMLRDCYDWLSEFCHPNFLSNFSAFAVDKQNNRIVFRHSNKLRKEDLQLMDYLDISSNLFVILFNVFTRKIAEAGLSIEHPL